MTPDTQEAAERRLRESESGGSEISLIRLVNIVLAHRSMVFACSILLFLVVVVVTLIRPRTYTTAASFTPQSERMSSNLAGIAAQFGVALPGGTRGRAPISTSSCSGRDVSSARRSRPGTRFQPTRGRSEGRW